MYMFDEKHYSSQEIKERNQHYVYMFRQLGWASKRTLIDLWRTAKDEKEKETLRIMLECSGEMKEKKMEREKKMFYVMNDNHNGLVVREATVFIDDKRNDKDLMIAQIGLHAATVIAANRNQLCDIDDIPNKIREMQKK